MGIQLSDNEIDILVSRFDKDGDGKLSDDERNAVREAIKASRSKGEQRQEKKK